jgi:hypothetical protein
MNEEAMAVLLLLAGFLSAILVFLLWERLSNRVS